jgi:hypothetical protein
MRNVVARCPRCGVEHDETANSICDACDTPLRAWCSRHGRETGWLASSACPRCAEETARPSPTRRAATLPCPDVSHTLAPAASISAPASAGLSPVEKVAADAAAPTKPTNLAGHLFVMLLIMLMTTGGSTLLGVIGGFVYVFLGYGATPGTPLRFALVGAVVGLAAGGYACWDYVKHLPAPPPES